MRSNAVVILNDGRSLFTSLGRSQRSAAVVGRYFGCMVSQGSAAVGPSLNKCEAVAKVRRHRRWSIFWLYGSARYRCRRPPSLSV